jgi:hypothetical protein
MNLPDIPEYVADYFNFLIDFSISPQKALDPFKRVNEIDKKLITFAALGTGFTWLNLILLQKLARANNDKSDIFRNIDKVDIETLPFMILLGVILFSIIVHVGVKLMMFISARIEKKKLLKEELNLISLKKTINGALGFFSFAPLVYILLFEFTMIVVYALNPRNINIFLWLILIAPAALFGMVCILYYLPKALSCIHPIGLSKKVYSLILTLYGLIMFLIAITSHFRK